MSNKKTGNAPSTDLTNQVIGNVFDLSYKKLDNFLLYCPWTKDNDVNKNITCSKMTFFKRVTDILSPLFDDDFDWNNIVIGGGLMSGLMERVFDNQLYEKSDIDLFIYNLPSLQICAKIKYICNALIKKFPDAYIFCYRSVPVFTILIPGKRTVQIIGFPKHVSNGNSTPLSILQTFDMTHCQIGIDMANFETVYTKEFLEAIQTKTTSINKKQGSIQLYRLVKAYHRGYSIKMPEKLYIKNYYHEYIQNFIDADEYLAAVEDKSYDTIMDKTPVNTNRLWRMETLENDLPDVFKDPIVQKNLDKNYSPEPNTPVDEALEMINSIYCETKITMCYDPKAKTIKFPLHF